MPALDGGGPTGLPQPETGLGTTARILLLAQNQLKDATGKHWGTDKLIPYLNLGIIEIIVLKPGAYTTSADLALAAGALQTLTASYFALIDAVCNLPNDVPGATITMLDKEAMDRLLPAWMTFPTSGTVSFVVLDPRDPKRYYVFPPQPSPAGKMRAIVSAKPTELEAADSVFPLDDSYEPAAVDYLVYRCLAEETTVPNALNKATMFRQKFLEDLGLKSSVEEKQSAKGK